MREPTADTKVSEEEGGGGAPSAGADSPGVRGADHGEAGHAPAAYGGPWWSRHPPVAQGGPHIRARGCPKKAVTPWRARAGAGSC